VTWGKARSWIEAGKVRVGDALVTELTARVAAGVLVAVDEQAPRLRAGARPEEADVVHVDAQLIVVSKPSGVSTVPYEGQEQQQADTLDARVRRWLERRPGAASRGRRPELGVVHRLDKETSGLVVFARTWLAKQRLSSQFRKHTVERRYLAIAHGDVRSWTAHSFLLENRGDGLRGSARGTPGPAAREAITHVERVEGLGGATLVSCRLETGRTHQIRIHLSEAGHPLVGEPVYVRGYPGPLLEAPRLMLHATELGFVHPSTERLVRWELPLPEDMARVLQALRASR